MLAARRTSRASSFSEQHLVSEKSVCLKLQPATFEYCANFLSVLSRFEEFVLLEQRVWHNGQIISRSLKIKFLPRREQQLIESLSS